MKILLGDFNELGRQVNFKPTTGNDSFLQYSNDNGVKSSKLCHIQKPSSYYSTKFPNRNFHKQTRTSPDGKTQNQIYHVLIARKWHSSIIDVIFFRGTDCDTDHHLLIAKLRERLSARKQATQKTDVERLNLKNVSEIEVRTQYQIENTNRLEP
jgi:hypothetical protein